MFKNELSDLRDEIKKTPEDEKRIEQPDRVVDIFEEILDFNRQNQEGKGLKLLTLEQMLSRLPITLAQLKAGNTLENLKHEIKQLLYFLDRSKYYLKMETIFMNTENSKTNKSHIFRLTLADKLNLKDPNKNVALANLSIYYIKYFEQIILLCKFMWIKSK